MSKRRREERSNRRRRGDDAPSFEPMQPRTRKPTAPKIITPLTKAQAEYDKAIFSNTLTFGVGPAGTGKTWWAATRAAQQLLAKEIDRILITRPAIEAGEQLGFLPGELEEKYEPYFRPVREALQETLGAGPLEYMLKNKVIEVAPLAYLRGATFKRCWVIADEMQNTTVRQMKMFLTRIGEDCRVIVNGDPAQRDIEGASGLDDALTRFKDVPEIAIVRFSRADVVRSGLCQRIVELYER